MDSKRTRLRSQAAVSKGYPAVYAPPVRGDIVEVEVEGEYDRGLPIVRGVNKRKRDPRGGGRRLHQRLESQEGSVSVTVDDNANASSDEIIKTIERYGSNASNDEIYSSAPSPTDVNTYVIIPEVMSPDQVAMKQLDKRRESSRLRIKPSKFREGFLLSPLKQRGDQKGADDLTNALEIVLPMEIQSTTATALETVRASTSSRLSEGELDSRLDRPSQTSSGKNKFKISYKSGAAKTTETSGGATDSLLSGKKGFDDVGLKAALSVVKRIMSIKSAEPFNEPVDPIALEIPDYLDVIKKPMDLRTIRELLEAGKKYRTVKDVADDVQLVWNNCRDYNQDGDPIMDILKIAENCFNKYWSAAGLPSFAYKPASKPYARQESNLSESTDELLATSDQQRDELRQIQSKDSKALAILNLSRAVHSAAKGKTQRSASVEQVMAESKVREDKLEVEDAVLMKQESSSSEGHANEEVVEDQNLQASVDEGLLTLGEVEKSHAGGLSSESVGDALKESEVKQAEVRTPVDQEARTPLQDKETSLRVASSNKRRTFGTVHHKPDCSCVVCVGRRRKLARQEREGITEGETRKKDKSKSHSRLTQETAQVTKSHVTKVSRPPKPPQVQEAVVGSAVPTEPEVVVETDRPDSHMGNSAEVETQVDGVRYYPATYELPLRKVNPSLFQISQILFDNNQDNVWKRHHSLGSRLPASMSKSSMFEAVHSLTLNER